MCQSGLFIFALFNPFTIISTMPSEQIPHHNGAVHMCDALLNLTCTEVDAIDSLEGLVHLCKHIDYEQELEVSGMLDWLAKRDLQEKAPCPLNIEMDLSSMSRAENDHSNILRSHCCRNICSLC